MIKYIKCPRCELNYIDADKQEYCDVCIAEMQGNKLQFADLDDEDFEKVIEGESTEICPVCGINYIQYGEKMCESCKSKQGYDEEEEIDPERDEEWKNYLDDSEDLSLEDAELDDELKEELEEELEDENEDDSSEYSDDAYFDDEDEIFDDDLDSYDDDEDDDDDDDDDLF